MSDTVTVRDLLAEVGAYRFEYLGRNDDSPVAEMLGGEAGMGWPWFTVQHDDARAVAVVLPWTEWGDYGGSLYDRANHDDIVENYGPEVLRLAGGWDSHSIALDIDGSVSECLADAVRYVAECGYLDDSDRFYRLTETLAAEAWDGFLARDFRRAVCEAVVGTPSAEADADCTRTDSGDLVPEGQALWDALHDGDRSDVYPEWEDETATSVVLRNFDECVARVAGDVVRDLLLPAVSADQGALL